MCKHAYMLCNGTHVKVIDCLRESSVSSLISVPAFQIQLLRIVGQVPSCSETSGPRTVIVLEICNILWV